MTSAKKSITLFILLSIIFPVIVFAMFHWYEESIQELPFFGKDYTMSTEKEDRFQISDFQFENESGTISKRDSIRGDVCAVNCFFSYCKTICPIIMPNLKKIQEEFAHDKDFKILSLSVDPERDSVARLKEYAQQLGIQTPQWHLLTGEKKLLYRFARNQLFLTATDGDGGPDDFIHSDKIVLIDRSGHIRGYYDGTEVNEIQKLIKDIRKILK